MTKCVICEKNFLPAKFVGNRQKYCSEECSRVAAYRRGTGIEVICKGCGKRFAPKRSNALSYCSRECAFKHQSRPLTRTKKVIKNELKCCDCGKSFQAYPNQQLKRCDACREKRRHIECYLCHKELTAEQVRHGAHFCILCRKIYNATLEQNRARSKTPIKRHVCRECGKEFITEYGDKSRVFCSIQCSRRFSKREHGGTLNQRARKMLRKYYGEDWHLHYEPINPAKIYARDGYECKICGRKITRLSGPMSKSIDHIIPLSEGGDHKPCNVQSAHVKCNWESFLNGKQLRMVYV